MKSGVKEITVSFNGKIVRISEARAMAGAMQKAEEEQGWEADQTGLEAFVLVDTAIAEGRDILIRIIKSTKPAVDADFSTFQSVGTATVASDLNVSGRSASDRSASDLSASRSHSVGSSKVKRSSTDLFGYAADPLEMNKSHRLRISPDDYGSGPYAQRVADVLHGRSTSSPASGERVAFDSPTRGLGFKSAPARERLGSKSPSPARERLGFKSLSPASERVVGNTSARERLVGGRDDTTSPGRRASTSPNSADHRLGRPFGRFVTPEVAREIQEAGVKLMKTRLIKVTELGEKFCLLSKLLLRDKETAASLLQRVVDLKKESDKIWNSSSSVKESY